MDNFEEKIRYIKKHRLLQKILNDRIVFKLKKDVFLEKKGNLYKTYGGLVSGIQLYEPNKIISFLNNEYFEMVDITKLTKHQIKKLEL